MWFNAFIRNKIHEQKNSKSFPKLRLEVVFFAPSWIVYETKAHKYFQCPTISNDSDIILDPTVSIKSSENNAAAGRFSLSFVVINVLWCVLTYSLKPRKHFLMGFERSDHTVSGNVSEAGRRRAWSRSHRWRAGDQIKGSVPWMGWPVGKGEGRIDLSGGGRIRHHPRRPNSNRNNLVYRNWNNQQRSQPPSSPLRKLPFVTARRDPRWLRKKGKRKEKRKKKWKSPKCVIIPT